MAMSDADRARARAVRTLNTTKSANSISNRDVQMSQEDYMKRNDGGMAMSGRGKPVRTF